MTSSISQHTLRIPRSLWQDLEETVIHQDRQFLTEVARSLGLPVADVLRRCLGTGGTAQSMPVLWTNPLDLLADTSCCPWWEQHGDGLWRRCPRQRLSESLPCQIHERCTPCPLARLDSDPAIREMAVVIPVRWQGRLYWIHPSDPDAPVYNEDGTRDMTGIRFRQITVDDERVWARTS